MCQTAVTLGVGISYQLSCPACVTTRRSFPQPCLWLTSQVAGGSRARQAAAASRGRALGAVKQPAVAQTTLTALCWCSRAASCRIEAPASTTGGLGGSGGAGHQLFSALLCYHACEPVPLDTTAQCATPDQPCLTRPIPCRHSYRWLRFPCCGKRFPCDLW